VRAPQIIEERAHLVARGVFQGIALKSVGEQDESIRHRVSRLIHPGERGAFSACLSHELGRQLSKSPYHC
jgi:hypothetical protein